MMNLRLVPTTLAAISILMTGCVQNAPWRTAAPQSCTEGACESTYLEQHPNFDLGYVELSERGNVFKRDHLDAVLDHVDDLANGPGGVTAVVFVHGWKHNAKDSDSNVKSFRRALHAVTADTALKKRLFEDRRLVGVYIGWRGRSIDLAGVEQLSYWDRKSVAQEVGKGGVTEVLARLRHAALSSQGRVPFQRHDRVGSSFLVIGHSFGGAMVLSAVNELLLDALVTAQTTNDLPVDCPGATNAACIEAQPFAHGLVLLNPAIEANQALQLKETAASYRYPERQIKTLHVISTDGDTATRIAFPAGQWLGVNLSWRQTDLDRNYDGKPLRLQEEELDTTTVGNFIPFRTARLEAEEGTGRWNVEACRNSDCGLNNDERASLIPTARHDPLVFFSTNQEFMQDHNDVFNCNVSAYLAAIVLDAQSRLVVEKRAPSTDAGSACNVRTYDFETCYNNVRARLKSMAPEIEAEINNDPDGQLKPFCR